METGRPCKKYEPGRSFNSGSPRPRARKRNGPRVETNRSISWLDNNPPFVQKNDGATASSLGLVEPVGADAALQMRSLLRVMLKGDDLQLRKTFIREAHPSFMQGEGRGVGATGTYCLNCNSWPKLLYSCQRRAGTSSRDAAGLLAVPLFARPGGSFTARLTASFGPGGFAPIGAGVSTIAVASA